MKTIVLFLSLVFLATFGYVFAINLQKVTEINYLIFMTLLVISMLICIVVVILNFPPLFNSKKRFKSLVYNSYSNKRTKNIGFDKQYSYANN